MPLSASSIQSRKPLPKAWRGPRDAELYERAGIGGCVFADASGFIRRKETFEGTIEMVRVDVTI